MDKNYTHKNFILKKYLTEKKYLKGSVNKNIHLFKKNIYRKPYLCKKKLLCIRAFVSKIWSNIKIYISKNFFI